MNTTNKFTMKNSLLCTLTLCLLIIASCTRKKVYPPNPNEEELITTLMITFTDSAGVHPTVAAIYRDLDGDGGNPPSTWDTIKLMKNTTYMAEIILLNESKNPVDTISNEVIAEGTDHIFCFETGPDITITRTDKDANNMELGIQSKWITANMNSTGNVAVILRHQPGTKNGTCIPGSTDVDIPFVYKIN